MANYKQMVEKIHQMQQEAEAVREAEVRGVIAKIQELMDEYGLIPEDLGRSQKVLRGAGKAKPPPKYRNPGTGETWSGRGKPPHWISTADADGSGRDSLLIRTPTGKAPAKPKPNLKLKTVKPGNSGSAPKRGKTGKAKPKVKAPKKSSARPRATKKLR